MNVEAPGRSCPLHYRYRASDFALPAHDRCEVLYVVGGLYGNVQALQRVIALFERERGDKRLVFNGDFHWFDVDPRAFERIQRGVSGFDATRGNVETELAAADAPDGIDAGCGCAYPEWVGDGVVERSNRILARLRDTARSVAGACDALQALPMWRPHRCGRLPRRRSCTAMRNRCRAGASRRSRCATRLHATPPRAGSRRRRSTCSRAATPACRCSSAHRHRLAAQQRRRRHAQLQPCSRGPAHAHRDTTFRWAAAALRRRRAAGCTSMRSRSTTTTRRGSATSLHNGRPAADAHLSYASRIADGPDYDLADALRVDPAPTEA